jgi:hypothetical protein
MESIYEPEDLPGTLMAFVDESEPYEVDQTAILTQDDKWILATASGCSCWDGEWSIERYDDRESLFRALGVGSDVDRMYNPSFAGVEALRAQVEAKLNA